MLTETVEQDETEVIETDEVEETESVEEASEESEQPEQPDESDDDGVDVITLDGEPIGQAEPEDVESAPIKQIRQEYRELAKKYKALEQQVQSPQVQASEPEPKLGPEPKPEDFDYVMDDFKEAVKAWTVQKIKVENYLAEKEAAQQAAVAEITAKVERYNEAKKKVRIPDFDEAEAAFADAIPDEKRGLFLKYSDRPESVVYAIGKSPELRAKFAAIDTPGQLIREIAILETRLAVGKAAAKAKIPPPEKPAPSGSAGGGVDETLAKLRAEADRTGDLTKVLAYKAKLKKAKA